MVAADRIAGLPEADAQGFDFVGAGPDGRDVAGALSALTGRGILANAVAASWKDGGPNVEMSVFGGKLTTTSGFTGDSGIVTVRPNVVTAEPVAAAGKVEKVDATGTSPSPRSRSSNGSRKRAPRRRSRRHGSSSRAAAASAGPMASRS